MLQPINNSDFSWLVVSDYWEESGYPFVEELREEIRSDTVIDKWYYQHNNYGSVGSGRRIGVGIRVGVGGRVRVGIRVGVDSGVGSGVGGVRVGGIHGRVGGVGSN